MPGVIGSGFYKTQKKLLFEDTLENDQPIEQHISSSVKKDTPPKVYKVDIKKDKVKVTKDTKKDTDAKKDTKKDMDAKKEKDMDAKKEKDMDAKKDIKKDAKKDKVAKVTTKVAIKKVAKKVTKLYKCSLCWVRYPAHDMNRMFYGHNASPKYMRICNLCSAGTDCDGSDHGTDCDGSDHGTDCDGSDQDQEPTSGH